MSFADLLPGHLGLDLEVKAEHFMRISYKPESQQHGTRVGGAGAHKWVYSDKGKKLYINNLAKIIKREWGDKPPILGPVAMLAIFYMENSDEDRAFKPHWQYKGPDTDNLMKSLKDAMTMAGVWRDDGQVFFDPPAKFWSSPEAGPMLEITICEYEKS